MREMKKLALAVIVFAIFMGSSVFGADAMVWGYFTDMNDNDLFGTVIAECPYFWSDETADGWYRIYLPAGDYEFTATSKGYETQVTQLDVEDDETYILHFEFQPE